MTEFPHLTLRMARALTVAIVAAAAYPAHAIPLKYEMVTDTLTKGVAVLQGGLRDAAWQEIDRSGAFVEIITYATTLSAVLPGGGATSHWSSEITLLRRDSQLVGGIGGLPPPEPPVVLGYYIGGISGRHVSDPPPHAGEASPGPLMLIPGAYSGDYLNDWQLPAFDLLKTAFAPHETDLDFMSTRLFDLNPLTDSLLIGTEQEIRLRAAFFHVPEPPTLALWCLAVLLFPVSRNAAGKMAK